MKDILTHRKMILRHKTSRKTPWKIEEHPWFLVVLLGSTIEQREKPFPFPLLSPLSLSSFSLFPFSLIPHVCRGWSSFRPLCLVNKRGKRWPRSATFPLEPTWTPFYFCISAYLRGPAPYTRGRPQGQNPESEFWLHELAKTLSIYI